MSDIKKNLGVRIKELRKNKGLTQEKLAELVEVDSKHMCRIERGVGFPSLDLLAKISSELEVEPYMLFQIKHLKSKEELITEISEILKGESIEKVRSFYKILLGLSL